MTQYLSYYWETVCLPSRSPGNGADTLDLLKDAGLGQGEGSGSALRHDVGTVHDNLSLLDHVGKTLVGGAHADGHLGQLSVDEINN